MDWQILAIALKDAKKEVKDIFLRNMSKRAAGMLEEDIEYLSSPTESDIENTRQLNEYYGGMIIRDAIKNVVHVLFYRRLRASTNNTER